MGKKGQNKIPDRWLDYTKVGWQIRDTKFVCFKVPLKAELVCNKTWIDRSQWFLPAQLVYELSLRGMRLGLLIDLTNTDRYYDPNDITSAGIRYAKINVTGQELPSLREVKEFSDVVDSFDATEQGTIDGEAGENLIGVHCTHGVNRTGYLVCRYLIERKGWSASKAVHEFGLARGHSIEKTHYIAALCEAERQYNRTKYGSVKFVSLLSAKNRNPAFTRLHFIFRMITLLKFLQRWSLVCMGGDFCAFCSSLSNWIF